MVLVSVLVFGVLTVMSHQLNSYVVTGLAALAGVFYGYAYGETVVGEETMPLIECLVGFAAAQGVISFGAYYLSKQAVNTDQNTGLISIRHTGFTVVGAGATFLGGLV